MDTASDSYFELLNFAGLPDDGRHRDEMLKLARQLALRPSENMAAFLWLHDEDKCRLHLDYQHPERTPLSGISLRIPATKRQDPAFTTSEIVREPRIQAWLRSHNVGTVPTLFPIAENFGFLNYFGSSTVPETPLINGLCKAIAARIIRHRVKRKLDINDAVVKIPWNDNTTANSWLQAAAEITKQHTKAKLVLVFRLNKDLRLEAVAGAPTPIDLATFAATPTSLVRQIYQRASMNRILDHYDDQERFQVFQTNQYDDHLVNVVEAFLGEQLRSWIGSAICYGRDPIAVMFVANKDASEYLPAVFSRTDNALVENICQLVSKAMPRVQTYAAIRRISSATFGKNAAEATSGEARLQTVFSAVSEHIPGLAGAAIGLRTRDSEPCIKQETSFLCNGHERELLEKKLSGPLNATASNPLPAADGFWYWDLDLPMVRQRKATLHLLLRRQTLAEHDHEILKYLCLDLGQFVRDQQAIRNQEREFVEFRHAVRSGLQGLGHLDTACEIYESITKHELQPSELRMRMLRKSLTWARLFATRTRHLVEQTRYLIDEIRREHLRPAACDIARIVSETIKCLQPDAEKRRLRVVFDNQLHSSPMATVDRFLIEITLFNLLDNAIKYSFRSRDIFVVLKHRNRFWEFAITDFGTYIHPDDYEVIFRPRVRRPTGQASATRPGTGIGLAVVKQVVDAHLGRIEVSSISADPRDRNEGAHTTFVLTLPKKYS